MPDQHQNFNPPQGILIEQDESYKIFQALYNAATGKTEKISKAYAENYRIEQTDIDQLHSKLNQMAGQWKVLSGNSSIVVQHLNDNKLTYSSYERFGIYDKSKVNPVESFSYELNLLIKNPTIEIPQRYKVTVRVLSRLALEEKMAEDIPAWPVFRLFASGSIVIEIEYVDYVVACTIVSTIDSWVNEVEISKNNGCLSFLQKRSHWIPRISQIILPLFAAYVFCGLAEKYMNTAAISFSILAKYLIISLTLIWLMGFIANIVAQVIENVIDTMIPLSLIKLNKGDEKLLEKHQIRKRNGFVKVASGLLVLVAQGVFTECCVKYIYDKLLGS